jgi:hypothetical protein
MTPEQDCGFWSFIGIGLLSIIILYTDLIAIPANSHGMKIYYGNVYDVASPGLNVRFLGSVDTIITGFDTDFKDNVTCKTRDNYYINIPRVYIDNEFSCDKNNRTCYTDIYVRYFMTDSKPLAKSISRYVPEDGMIFKHLPEIMTNVCRNLTAYETQTDKWVAQFPTIVKHLQEKVPHGIKISGVRLDRPILPNVDWIMSASGVISSWIYRTVIGV